MRACIVGHGPSMCRNEYGPEIDRHDKVIRMKKSQNLLQRPNLFGSKTDIVCASVVVNKAVVGDWCKDYWLFTDTRTDAISEDILNAIRASFLPNTCLIDRELCKQWTEFYRKMRGPQVLDDRQHRKGSTAFWISTVLSDDLGHLHCSAGMFTIIHAMAHLKPKHLNLFGFDNMRTGSFDWSVTRGPEWKEYPDHNWSTEQKMLPEVAKHYGYTIHHDAEVMRCSSGS